MERSLDLYRARREELVAVIVRQREQIAELEQRLAHQEAELATLRTMIQQLTARVGVLQADRDPADSAPPPPRPPCPGSNPPRAARLRPSHGHPGNGERGGTGGSGWCPPPASSMPSATVRPAAPRCGAGRTADGGK